MLDEWPKRIFPLKPTDASFSHGVSSNIETIAVSNDKSYANPILNHILNKPDR